MTPMTSKIDTIRDLDTPIKSNLNLNKFKFVLILSQGVRIIGVKFTSYRDTQGTYEITCRVYFL